jgi:hypothetical protein
LVVYRSYDWSKVSLVMMGMSLSTPQMGQIPVVLRSVHS